MTPEDKKRMNDDFWYAPTHEELAEAQGVDPSKTIDKITGTWPMEMFEGFDEFIRDMRESNIVELHC